jgi:hypothetical protein
MKNKLKSCLSVIAITGVMGVPLLISSAPVLPVDASLTAPASYDINYAYNTTNSRYYLGGSSPATSGEPLYTRSADGVYYNYTTTINNTDYNDNDVIPEGLEITMTFNRSNTTWGSQGSPPNPVFYKPTENKIGSNNSVGTLIGKIDIIFENNTHHDYKLTLDYSSTSSLFNVNVFINGSGIGFYFSTQERIANTSFANTIISSFSTLRIQSDTTSGDRYFDAWYLKDLGVSPAYDAGYDAGYDVGEDDGYEDGLSNNPNVLINGVESLIGMFVNFVFIIFSLEIFGVSILSIAGILFGIVAVVWVLKTIRG